MQSPDGRPDIDIQTWWEGAGSQDLEMLEALLDSCLAAASRDVEPTLQSPELLHAVKISTKSCWEGTESHDMDMLDKLLDSCLVVGSCGAESTMRTAANHGLGIIGLLKGMSDGLFDVTATHTKGYETRSSNPKSRPKVDTGYRLWEEGWKGKACKEPAFDRHTARAQA